MLVVETIARKSDCVFCGLQADRIIASNALARAIHDNYPVTELHTLVIPKRHATTFFDLFELEKRAINQLLDGLRVEIMKKDASVSGFNIGINSGDAAGQTIGHAHSSRRCARPKRWREGCDTG